MEYLRGESCGVSLVSQIRGSSSTRRAAPRRLHDGRRAIRAVSRAPRRVVPRPGAHRAKLHHRRRGAATTLARHDGVAKLEKRATRDEPSPTRLAHHRHAHHVEVRLPRDPSPDVALHRRRRRAFRRASTSLARLRGDATTRETPPRALHRDRRAARRRVSPRRANRRRSSRRRLRDASRANRREVPVPREFPAARRLRGDGGVAKAEKRSSRRGAASNRLARRRRAQRVEVPLPGEPTPPPRLHGDSGSAETSQRARRRRRSRVRLRDDRGVAKSDERAPRASSSPTRLNLRRGVSRGEEFGDGASRRRAATHRLESNRRLARLEVIETRHPTLERRLEFRRRRLAAKTVEVRAALSRAASDGLRGDGRRAKAEKPTTRRRASRGGLRDEGGEVRVGVSFARDPSANVSRHERRRGDGASLLLARDASAPDGLRARDARASRVRLASTQKPAKSSRDRRRRRRPSPQVPSRVPRFDPSPTTLHDDRRRLLLAVSRQARAQKQEMPRDDPRVGRDVVRAAKVGVGNAAHRVPRLRREREIRRDGVANLPRARPRRRARIFPRHPPNASKRNEPRRVRVDERAQRRAVCERRREIVHLHADARADGSRPSKQSRLVRASPPDVLASDVVVRHLLGEERLGARVLVRDCRARGGRERLRVESPRAEARDDHLASSLAPRLRLLVQRRLRDEFGRLEVHLQRVQESQGVCEVAVHHVRGVAAGPIRGEFHAELRGGVERDANVVQFRGAARRGEPRGGDGGVVPAALAQHVHQTTQSHAVAEIHGEILHAEIVLADGFLRVVQPVPHEREVPEHVPLAVTRRLQRRAHHVRAGLARRVAAKQQRGVDGESGLRAIEQKREEQRAFQNRPG